MKNFENKIEQNPDPNLVDLESGIGKDAVDFLHSKEITIKRNSKKETETGSDKVYEFRIEDRIVTISHDLYPANYFKLINNPQSIYNPRDDGLIDGWQISFYFSDSKKDTLQGFEIKQKLQSTTMDFLKTMLQLITSVKNNVILIPTDTRRIRIYMKKLEKIESPPIYMMFNIAEEMRDISKP